MAFLQSDLLLTADKLAQLTNALASLGQADPLQTCITEATADVARFTASYTLEAAATNGFIRALALYRAYALAGTGVPPEVQKNYDESKAELVAISEGKRKNLPSTSTVTGNYGGETQLTMRTHQTT